ncbi:MAG TPA: cytochrome c [Polyangia bacterium]|jgi:hypothetical protein
MRNKLLFASSTVAIAIALALLLRPARSIRQEPQLATPERIPPAARAVIASKMRHHAEQLPTLVSRTVVLDYDGVARVAGEIFDEPRLARPLTGDELNGLLPERFFALQDELHAGARRVVEAAARHDSQRMAVAFGALTQTCIACHDVYLRGVD